MVVEVPEQRFWAKVDKTPECWLWKASVQPAGYGQFWLNGTYIGAHRYAYQLLVGPIPDGLQVDHLCRVRACVNPGHMEVVTLSENVLRGTGISAMNARKTHCLRRHSLVGNNLILDRRNRRCCRICKAASDAGWPTGTRELAGTEAGE